MSMVTLNDDAPVDPDDELLVAYIDGELDRENQVELENRLLDDERLRSRLQQLQTGWELLDDLPDPSPGLKLVESTLELVVEDVVKARPSSGSIWSRWRLPILVAACCVVGVVTTLAVASVRRSRAFHRQLVDLAIVEHLDAYKDSSDLALMRQIAADQRWTNMILAARETGIIPIESSANLAATPVEEREERIENLTPEDRKALNWRWEHFNRLDETIRERIRRTAQAVAIQDDAESLLQTMRTYSRWRETLPTSLRDKIESDDPKQRREAISEAISITQDSINLRSGLLLDEETIEWIYVALRQILQQRLDSGDKPTIDLVERTKGREDAEYFVIRSIASGGFRRWPGGGPRSIRSRQVGPGPGGTGGRRPPVGIGRPSDDRPAPLQPDELEVIRWVLTDQALDLLDVVSYGDPVFEAENLRSWAATAVDRKRPWREESTPLERYQELPERERDLLDLLPPEEIQKRLSPEPPRFFSR